CGHIGTGHLQASCLGVLLHYNTTPQEHRNTMNTRTSAFALILALAAPCVHAAEPRVDHIVDLPAVQVRAPAPRVDHIVTLPTVHVRPQAGLSAGMLAQASARVVTLATVHVRPTAQQLAERASVLASRQAGAAATALASELAAELAAQARP